MNEKIMIEINNVTKDYKKGRGNFNIDLKVYEGEALGIVGENGAGKTTLLRQLMGYVKSDKGNISILGLDAYKDSAKTKKYIGYIPGEINFPDVKTGIIFLHNYGDSLGMKKEDYAYAEEIISRMQLDVRAYPKRMSKGMKQKTAIVAALMLKADILIMDEPTIGLDPLMREEFLKLVLEQKERGATIIYTSNTVNELERTCDRVVLLTKGKIASSVKVDDVINRPYRDYKIEFNNNGDYKLFLRNKMQIIRMQDKYNQVSIRIKKNDVPILMKTLTRYDVKFISEIKYDLNSYFEEVRKGSEENERND
jgi:ABC-2 type transport system ATP-binding protein